MIERIYKVASFFCCFGIIYIPLMQLEFAPFFLNDPFYIFLVAHQKTLINSNMTELANFVLNTNF